MIYTIADNKKYNYSTPLIEYIKEKHLYNGENLIYTSKYTDGTFSITNPTLEYKNCEFVNGYPHFNIPLDVCLEEIDFFLKGGNMYDYQFNIRYGDTHPHKPVPKLAQVRNITIENSLHSMIGNNVNSYYGVGDISIKSLTDFASKYGIDIPNDELFIKLVNNTLDDSIRGKLLDYDRDAINKIRNFLNDINFPIRNFLLESTLYYNQDLYQKLKNDELYKDNLKDNGELKYSLQELMFIYSIIKSDRDVLINIIGANQTDHVLKVSEILEKSDPNVNCKFLTYGICRNADERDYSKWQNYFEEFIMKNNITINNRLITSDEFLKILITVLTNDNIMDFDNLDKYLKNIQTCCDGLSKRDYYYDNNIIHGKSDLICKMALVGYTLNRSIEMCNQNNFYKYLLSVMNEYESNKEKYYDMRKLYYEFIRVGFSRLGFKEDVKRRVLVK